MKQLIVMLVASFLLLGCQEDSKTKEVQQQAAAYYKGDAPESSKFPQLVYKQYEVGQSSVDDIIEEPIKKEKRGKWNVYMYDNYALYIAPSKVIDVIKIFDKDFTAYSGLKIGMSREEMTDRMKATPIPSVKSSNYTVVISCSLKDDKIESIKYVAAFK